MSDIDDMFNDSRPIMRQFSAQSYTDETQAESMNLLAEGRSGDGEGLGGEGEGRVGGGGAGGQVEDANTLNLLRGLKRSMDSLQTDVKRLKDQVCLLKKIFILINLYHSQNKGMDTKLTNVLKKNDNLEKLVKDLTTKSNKVD